MKTGTAPLPPLEALKVLEQPRGRIRTLHYSLRTERAYVHWVRKFIRLHGVRDPARTGLWEVEAFLAWLAGSRGVSASNREEALCAPLFFDGEIPGWDLRRSGRVRNSARRFSAADFHVGLHLPAPTNAALTVHLP